MPEGPERIDYRETSDVTEVHGAIKREHVDPRADVTPIPVWLTAVCGIAVCWAGAYLGVFHGGFSPNVFNERASSPGLLFPSERKTTGLADAGATQSLVQMGKSIYSNCQPCHQAAGMGIPGQFPPLVGTEWVVGGEKRLIALLLKGMQGPLTVNGSVFNGVMPPWEKQLTDKKIAAVASYVRASWGNNAGEISEAKVGAARKEFAAQTTAWTAEQLAEIPPDANLPDAAGSAPAPSSAPAGSAAPAPAAPLPTPGSAPAAAAVAPPASTPTPASASAAAARAPGAVPNAAALIAEGKKHYMLVCVACHQPNGLGLPMVFPPLAKTEYVTGSPERFAAMILKGNAGPMTIAGKPYNNIMPGQEAMLDDAKIAAIMSYVRSAFGNNAPPVSPELVAATRRKFTDRKTPWMEAELKAWKDESSAPGGTGAGPNPAAAPQNPPIPAAPGAAPLAPPTQPGTPGNTPPAPAPSPGSTPAQSAPPAAPASSAS